VKIVRVSHRRRPLRDRFAIQWDNRRPMPSYGKTFCQALADDMRMLMPVTRPSDTSAGLHQRATGRPAGRRA
jgi:LysR family transcriptional regulator, nitrogen assimilation regulatory protein